MKKLDTAKCLEAYQAAINQIDDYLEYRAESDKDRRCVLSILDSLTDKLIWINVGADDET